MLQFKGAGEVDNHDWRQYTRGKLHATIACSSREFVERFSRLTEQCGEPAMPQRVPISETMGSGNG